MAKIREKTSIGGGLLHREVHVWLYNSKGEVILQKRSLNKDTFPGLLDVSVGGHVELNNSYEEAAIKETKEETGIVIDKSKLVFVIKTRDKFYDKVIGVRNNKFSTVYAYEYNGLSADLEIEKDKVISLEFWPIDKILNLADKDKEQFIFLMSKNYIDIFRKIRILVKSKHP